MRNESVTPSGFCNRNDGIGTLEKYSWQLKVMFSMPGAEAYSIPSGKLT
jgi:hypothetical protein